MRTQMLLPEWRFPTQGPGPRRRLRCRPAAAAAGLLAAAILLGQGILLPGRAAAQSDPSLQAVVAKLNRLEADLNSLQRNVYRGTLPARDGAQQPEPPAAGDVGAQFYVYEESLRRLTAQVEELAHRQRQIDDRLTRLSEDAEFRLQEIEGKLGLGGLGGAATGRATAPVPDAAASDAGTQQLGTLSADRQGGQPRGATDTSRPGGRTAPPGAATAALTAPDSEAALTGTPRERYNASLRLIRVGQLGQAETALQAFLKDYPTDDLAGNAQYWLGETYYARNEYEQAAAAFLAGYRNHPKSAKAPDNLLKLGVSLVAMGQKSEACPVFTNLLTEFPDAPRLVLDRARNEKSRAGC